MPPANNRNARDIRTTRLLSRRVWATVIGVLTAFAAIALWLRDRGERGARTPNTGAPMSPAMDGMGGMAGMNMSADGSVELTASQLRQFGVLFGRVEQRAMSDEIRAVGTVIADEARVSTVTLKFAGFVEKLDVNTTGQPVRRGQRMAEIYSPDLFAAQQELLIARDHDRTMSVAGVPGVPSSGFSLLDAARERLRLWDVSEAQIEETLRTGRAARTIALFAPATGVIAEKFVQQGQAVQSGTPLYSIADLSTVWVTIQLREADADLVREGAVANLEFTAFPGRPFRARVAFVYPTVGDATRTLAARLVVNNSDGRLKPGMYATARVATTSRTALTVPSTAVVQTGDRALVFVDMGAGRLVPQDVVLGRATGEFSEVLAGLEPGQRVVTSAQFLLESESNLAEVMKSMIGMSGAGAMEDMPGMNMSGADTRGLPGAAAKTPASSPPATPTGKPPAPRRPE